MSRVTQPETMTEVVTPPVAVETAHTYRVQLQPRSHVTFDESVVDNEHLGRRRSKKCCIFHKKRDFGESSSESDEFDSDSDGEHHHQRDCKHKAPRRRTKPKKHAPSPSTSDEEKAPALLQ